MRCIFTVIYIQMNNRSKRYGFTYNYLMQSLIILPIFDKIVSIFNGRNTFENSLFQPAEIRGILEYLY